MLNESFISKAFLLEIGFSRLELPNDREGTSVYTLNISENRCIYLRAFGILYVDTKYGSIFLPRYEFLPEYTEQTTLDKPPWTKKDLPKLKEISEIIASDASLGEQMAVFENKSSEKNQMDLGSDQMSND